MLTEAEIKQLVNLRHQLHQIPELSGKEEQTSQLIKIFLEQHNPDEIIEHVGGFGILAIFDSKKPGPAICFRGEMDALPIEENNDLEYSSNNPGVAHKCGHDGHMTMISGLAMLLKKKRPARGKIILLYQPAEETGEGAAKVVEDEKFRKLKPDYIIGLHNLPGYHESAIISRAGVFAAASKGMVIKLKGATAHAAEPENGRSPALAMAEIIKNIQTLPTSEKYESFVLATIVHAQLGQIAFGTTPGYAEVRATLRSYTDADIDKITNDAEKIVKKSCEAYQLDCEISYTEIFPATESSHKLLQILKEIVIQHKLKMIDKDQPFRWSEDFGHYKKLAPSLFFGLGAGEIPNLHNFDYDFPDSILSSGINIFYALASSLLE